MRLPNNCGLLSDYWRFRHFTKTAKMPGNLNVNMLEFCFANNFTLKCTVLKS